jgi:hypothetical protein
MGDFPGRNFMPTRFVYSVQSFLKWKGRNPGPLDGDIGPLTTAAWNLFLDSEEERIATPAISTPENSQSPPETPGAQGAPISNPPARTLGSAELIAAAKANVGKLLTRNAPGTDNGTLACAYAVTHIVKAAGFEIEYTLSTDDLFAHLCASSHWQETSLDTPGSIIVSPTCSAMHGHTGIIAESGLIYSNSSARAEWEQNFTLESWRTYYARCGYHAFSPKGRSTQSAEGTTPVSEPKSPGAAIGFEANGSNARIRGRFSLSESQMEHICSAHPFSAYARYGPAIIANSNHYGINPLFVLADLVNQGVNPAYNNPWGISTDHYPHGPNNSELGQPNDRVKNGPRKFADSEWRIAFDRQFAVVESGKAYTSANTIGEWAKIDAPAGAENDVHGTNSAEGAEVGHLYNLVVSRLT